MFNAKYFTLSIVVFLLAACQSAPVSPQKEILPEKLASPQRNQIVFLGDSGTYGGNMVSVDDQTFPALIDKYFFENNLPYMSVNAGVNGDTTWGAIDRLDQYLNPRTALVVLDIGANDFFRKEPSDQIKERLRTIIARIREHNIGVFLFTYTLQSEFGEGGGRFKAAYQDLIAEYSLPTLEKFQPDWVNNARQFSPDHNPGHFTVFGHSGVASQLLRILNPKWIASPEELAVTDAMVRSITYWLARESR